MITEEHRKSLQTQLACSNLALSKYYKQISSPKGRKGFVAPDGENINRPKFYNKILKLSKLNPNSDLTLYGITISKSEIQNILSLEKIKLEVIDSVHNMVVDLVNKNINKIKDPAFSFDDLLSIGVSSVLKSLHSYCRDEICFSTYFYTCVKREINNLCGRSSPLSKISNKSVDLKRKYIEAKKLINYPATFDEIVATMKIKEKDVELLRKTLDSNTILSEENMIFAKNHAGIDGSKRYFYSGSSRGVPILSGTGKEPENLFPSLSFESIDFSPLEKAVFDGFMQSSSKLGISSIAKGLLNPKTGKPFSRMAITYAWRRVMKKLNSIREAA